MIDVALWNRGQEPRYKAIPRHRTRSVCYYERGGAGPDGAIGLVCEQPVHAQVEELLVLGGDVPVGRGVGPAPQLGGQERVLATERVNVHQQPGAMSAPDEAGRPARAAVGLERHHVVLRGPHPVGVAGDPAQARRIGGYLERAQQLDERQPGAAVEALQAVGLEGLDEHARAAPVQVVAPQRAQ